MCSPWPITGKGGKITQIFWRKGVHIPYIVLGCLFIPGGHKVGWDCILEARNENPEATGLLLRLSPRRKPWMARMLVCRHSNINIFRKQFFCECACFLLDGVALEMPP